MRMRTLGIALAVLAVGAYAFAGEPTTNDLRMIGEGRALYLNNCGGCHGATLKGGEVRAPLAGNLSLIENRDTGFSRMHVAAHIRFGSSRLSQWLFSTTDRPSEMPPWGSLRALSADEAQRMLAIAKLTRYLEWAQAPSTAVASAR